MVAEEAEPEITEEEIAALIEGGRDYWYARNGVEKDNDKALALFQEAAAYDSADAWYYVGLIFHDRGDYDSAISAYEKAIGLGSDLARLTMGFLYQNGNGVEKDYDAAMSLYEEAVDHGCVEANVGLGDLYQSGYGVEQDDETAVDYFLKATEGAEPDWTSYAYESLGWMYYSDQYAFQDAEKAIGFYEEANRIAQSWTVKEALYIAEIYAQGLNDAANAQEWIEKAETVVKDTDGAGLAELGYVYRDGVGVEQDGKKALDWYRRAGEAGNANGYYAMARMYRDGNGIHQSGQEAIRWYQKQAEAGSAVGYSNIANMYCEGIAVEMDAEKAIEWYVKSAEAGFTNAYNRIGWMYENGFRKSVGMVYKRRGCRKFVCNE